MSKIGWVIAGSVATVTTIVVSVKMALELEDDTPQSKPKKRESQAAKTKRIQTILRHQNIHNPRPKWRYER